jgi:hypothetical protein
MKTKRWKIKISPRKHLVFWYSEKTDDYTLIYRRLREEPDEPRIVVTGIRLSKEALQATRQAIFVMFAHTGE